MKALPNCPRYVGVILNNLWKAIGRNELQVVTVLNHHSALLLWPVARRTEVVSALNVTQTDRLGWS